MRRAAGGVVDDLDVLSAGVEDLEDVLIVSEQIKQRRQVDARGQRVDRRGLFLICDLHQAQFGPIGVFAHELSVDGNEFGLCETLADGFQFAARCDQRMYLHMSGALRPTPQDINVR